MLIIKRNVTLSALCFLILSSFCLNSTAAFAVPSLEKIIEATGPELIGFAIMAEKLPTPASGDAKFGYIKWNLYKLVYNPDEMLLEKQPLQESKPVKLEKPFRIEVSVPNDVFDSTPHDQPLGKRSSDAYDKFVGGCENYDLFPNSLKQLIINMNYYFKNDVHFKKFLNDDNQVTLCEMLGRPALEIGQMFKTSPLDFASYLPITLDVDKITAAIESLKSEFSTAFKDHFGLEVDLSSSDFAVITQQITHFFAERAISDQAEAEGIYQTVQNSGDPQLVQQIYQPLPGNLRTPKASALAPITIDSKVNQAQYLAFLNRNKFQPSDEAAKNKMLPLPWSPWPTKKPDDVRLLLPGTEQLPVLWLVNSIAAGKAPIRGVVLQAASQYCHQQLDQQQKPKRLLKACEERCLLDQSATHSSSDSTPSVQDDYGLRHGAVADCIGACDNDTVTDPHDIYSFGFRCVSGS